jgi:hypothetical protein
MRLGFSTCNKPISQHVRPLAGKTTNRRAVCREIRMSGSEGGASKPIDASYLYNDFGLTETRTSEPKSISFVSTPREVCKETWKSMPYL